MAASGKMKTSLTFLIISSLLLGVYSNCNIEECKTELRAILSNSYFCNSSDIQKNAGEALMKCIYGKDKKEMCPEAISHEAAEIGKEIDAKYDACGVRQERASCGGAGILVCLLGIGNIAKFADLATITTISEACDIIKPGLETLDICKSCIGGFFGDAWVAVRDDVELMWGRVTSLLGGACDCAARIETTMNNIDYASTCRTIEYASRAAIGIAEECVLGMIESFETYDWLSLTREYISAVGVYSNNFCFFGGQGSSSSTMVFLSSGTVLLVFLYHFLNLVNRN